MKEVIKLALTSLLIVMLAAALPAAAVKPVYTGVKYPVGDPSGMVMGRVVTAVNGTTGLAGAYVAIVDANDVTREYGNTTSDANGSYSFTGVNVTGSSAYKVYASKSPLGEGYSAAFGAVANTAVTTSVVILVPESTGTPTPPASNVTATPTPTVTAIASDLPAPTTSAPQPSPAVPAITAILVIGFVAYCIRKNKQ